MSFNSLWELDGVRTLKRNNARKRLDKFHPLWELDGVRHHHPGHQPTAVLIFQFPWELDGVRTEEVENWVRTVWLQFPVGIRWCSDITGQDTVAVLFGDFTPCGN